MRIRHSVSRFLALLAFPAISLAAIAYFTYYAICGERGYVVLTSTRAELQAAQGQLAALRGDRLRLEHRIRLLKPGQIDPDLVEELARGQLLESQPGQVDVPRNSH